MSLFYLKRIGFRPSKVTLTYKSIRVFLAFIKQISYCILDRPLFLCSLFTHQILSLLFIIFFPMRYSVTSFIEPSYRHSRVFVYDHLQIFFCILCILSFLLGLLIISLEELRILYLVSPFLLALTVISIFYLPTITSIIFSLFLWVLFYLWLTYLSSLHFFFVFICLPNRAFNAFIFYLRQIYDCISCIISFWQRVLLTFF